MAERTEEAVIYIVEVKDKAGNVGTKEYQALSPCEAPRMAERELEAYPSSTSTRSGRRTIRCGGFSAAG